jgi:predicted RecA/RadA family phage recombinase
MKNFVQDGNHVDFVATADHSGGDFVAVGSLTGVVQGDVKTGETGVLVRKGVFSLGKTSAQAWTVGDKIYATGAGVMTTSASGNTLAGVAVADTANPSDTGVVLLTGQVV